MTPPLDLFGAGARLHHVGYAVASIDRLAAGTDRTTDPIQQVTVAFLDLHGLPIELVEPAGPDCPITQLLRQRHSIYHACFEVPDLEAALLQAEACGLTCIRPPVPATAFGGRRITWLLHRVLGLFELLEASSPC